MSEETRSAAFGRDVTPSDTEDLLDDGGYSVTTRGVYVGTSGDVAVMWADGTTTTFVAPATGIAHPWKAKRILDTGTTASDIVALF